MYNTYADDIFRFLIVRVRDRELAEDLTSETFAKAWAHIDRFDFKQPRPWLYRIAQNAMTDHWRKQQPQLLAEDEELASDAESIEDQTDRQLTKEAIQSALIHLPDTMRSVVTLRFMLGYSARKTAESLGTTEGNIRVVQHRALQKLKELLS